MIQNLANSFDPSKSLTGLMPNIKLKNPLAKIAPPKFKLKKRSVTGIPEYTNDKIPVNYILDTINEKGIKTLTVGNFRNGRVPLDKMVKNEHLAKDLGGDAPYLMLDASKALDKLMKLYEEAKFDGKQTVFFTDAYRSLARQVALRKKTRNAARAGKSNHGWGLAVDIHWGVPPSMNRNRSLLASAFRHPVYKWFFENAPKCGWINPFVLRDFKSTDEWWHWEFRKSISSTSTIVDKPLVSRYLGDFTKEDLQNILDSGGTFENSDYLINPPKPSPGGVSNSPSVSKLTAPDISKFRNLNRSGILPKLKQSPLKTGGLQSIPRPTRT
jgi:hypothetical protein